LPDGSEDLPLATLGAALAGSFKGEPGKQLSSLIAKLVSSKMPPSFNRQAIQRYLGTRWGLGPQRQNTVIVFSITLEPAARLANADAAQAFFDGVAQRYASFAGVTLSAASGGASASQATVVDSEALQAVKKDHQKSLLKIHEVITNLVKEMGDGEDDEAAETADNSLLEKLDHWVSEFGDDMYLGTKPIFDARKIRVYDAWWNWVRVDLIELKQELLKGLITSSDISDRIRMILNRWTSSCGNILKSLSPEHTVVEQLKTQTSSLKESCPVFVYTKPAEAPRTRIDEAGKTIYEEVPRGASGQSLTFAHLIKGGTSGLPKPVIQLKQQDGNEWKSNRIWTDIYVENLIQGETAGLSFSATTALVTGAGPGSIASGIVQGLLQGGAQVFVTTSRPPPAATTKFFEEMYKTYGSKGSKLTVMPFNQASKQDCEALVNHIYDTKDEARDLDVIVPFAAIGETGQLDGIDAKSELAHRLMLTNLLRMLGHVKQQKEKRRFNTRPTSVILPLSPNHGTFGGDGLYSESKLGLETLFNRFHSEGWSDYLTIVGAVIGWTRGTGLMSTNNILAEAVEAEKSITFSSSEMAFSILALIHPEILAASENEPILADISGNLSEIRDLKAIISKVRQQLSDRTKLQQALNEENRRIDALLTAPEKDAPKTIITPQTERVNLKVGYPELPNFSKATAGLADLEGLVDLSKTVVVVGFSELGPWGSSRTRWEMEYRGDFTTAGMVEIAWIMGLIEHVDGQVNGAPYAGWVDAKTKQPIQDGDIGATFGKYVLEHTGYRTIEPEILDGYDPNKKEFLHEVVLDEDLPTFQASRATAEAFQLEHGNSVTISPVAETDEYLVKVKKGTRLLIPKAVAFNRTVAGLLPTGWNPAKYGIPDDIISQVDPITAYVLCCVAEALYSAGIKDPFEIFAYMNTSELANCIGTGAGGLAALRKMYRERYLEHSVQSDIFQETFLNTPGAWVNLLLLSSTGPIKTNSGACATAIE
jgi:fatty acid synthase subunit alpha, fungi type